MLYRSWTSGNTYSVCGEVWRCYNFSLTALS
uniref:Uncharacterized protein n=1 Tax=Anopheles funestus TaxID=62324 RepID=A0A182S2Q4_ANOFN